MEFEKLSKIVKENYDENIYLEFMKYASNSATYPKWNLEHYNQIIDKNEFIMISCLKPKYFPKAMKIIKNIKRKYKQKNWYIMSLRIVDDDFQGIIVINGVYRKHNNFTFPRKSVFPQNSKDFLSFVNNLNDHKLYGSNLLTGFLSSKKALEKLSSIFR
ncbi:MAG: hypothetical protein HeimC2_13800 [Candidatus Heimdallarchaeota archaeon LC_2]|nr:MAG: hypothetical protein HeimC2_13800 [Candidatus Heimdallarchaeota archaeon LC_2]